MDFQTELDRLCRSTEELQGALLLDANGEVVIEVGARDDRLRLIGVYQGIALQTARKAAEPYTLGEIDYLLSRHTAGTVVVRPLKEGFFLVFAFTDRASVASSLRQTANVQEAFNADL